MHLYWHTIFNFFQFAIKYWVLKFKSIAFIDPFKRELNTLCYIIVCVQYSLMENVFDVKIFEA